MFKVYKVTDHGTDGRDTSTVGYFATPELADEVKKGHGAMGFGDGSVDVITVFEASDPEALRFTKAGRAAEQAEKDRALAKLTDRERKLLGLDDEP